jgi:hypothetical protein
MTFSDEDKAYIRNIVEHLTASQNQVSDGSGKEFHMHIYDALWENMRSKESRLWTFLSLYGAAVGLVFAGGQVSQIPGADLFAIVIVMALSTWAVLIILNANWWYYRNQLMVSRIEVKYPIAVKGVVPKIYYENPNYRVDQLSESSILLLSLLMLLLYSRTIWSYHHAGTIYNLQSLFVVILLYVLFILSVDYCLRLHESYVAAYYVAKKVILNDETAPIEPSVDARLELIKDEIATRKILDVRTYVLFLLAVVAGFFDFVIYRNGITLEWLGAIIGIQVLAAVIFLVQKRIYRQSYSEEELKAAKCDQQVTSLESKLKLTDKFWYRPWHMILLMLISAIIAASHLYRNSQKLQEDWNGTKATLVTDMGEQINKMQQDFQGLQRSYNELQQSNVQLQKRLLDEKLKPYTTREESEQRFITREEFNKFSNKRPQQNNKDR